MSKSQRNDRSTVSRRRAMSTVAVGTMFVSCAAAGSTAEASTVSQLSRDSVPVRKLQSEVDPGRARLLPSDFASCRINSSAPPERPLPFSGEACRVAADAAVVLHTDLTDR